jgi:hypothetical protein
MNDILETAHQTQEGPALTVRKAPLGPLWSVWAVLEGTHSEEIFESSSEQEALDWIDAGGQTWLEERRQRRSA